MENRLILWRIASAFESGCGLGWSITQAINGLTMKRIVHLNNNKTFLNTIGTSLWANRENSRLSYTAKVNR